VARVAPEERIESPPAPPSFDSHERFIMKTCTVCKQEKSLSDFGKQKGAKNGLRSACKKCHTTKAKKYAEQNKEKIAEYRKTYNLLNSKSNKEKCRQYNDLHKEVQAEKRKQWKKENPDLVRIYNQNRKSVRRKQTGLISYGIVKKLMGLQKGLCANCGSNLKTTGHHMDHKIPISLGGEHADENLELLCPTCNLRKYNKDPIAWANENGRLL
jgi:5-methylcytosine-specific restriction endonuclease McrA